GTKLGPGGLVKAYSGSVKNALEGLSLNIKRNLIILKINFGYSYINEFKLIVQSHDSDIIEEIYETDVRMTVEVPKEKKHSFIQAITDLTAGAINVD
ncbi:MAG: DUF1949 domain-containing protein, partial [Oceanospirillaceae bacterium]